MALLVSLACLALGATVPLAGTVVDPSGRPVAGAAVWLGDTYVHPGPEVLAATETDAEGRFRLERGAELAGRGGFWSPTLWAYKPGSRLAFVEFKANLPAADEPVSLALGPPASTPLRVLGPDGQAAAGVRVRVVLTNLKAPRPPDGLLDRLAATTDADGRATIDGLAPADVAALDVTAPGQLVQCLPLDAESGIVALRPLGRLRVRVVADDPKAAQGWSVRAWSRPATPGYRGPATHWVSVTTGEDGRGEFQPVAEGVMFSWEIKPPAGSAYLVAREPSTRIRAGATEEVEIPIVRAVRVEGVVRADPGGEPISGAKVHLIPLRGGTRAVHDIAMDDQGRFSALMVPGTIRLSFAHNGVPKEYFLSPRAQHWVDFEVKEGETRHEVEPPRLRRGALVRGRVVDEGGKPAPMVYLSGGWASPEFGNLSSGGLAQTDARGEFVVGNLPAQVAVHIRASLGFLGESEEVTVPSAGDGEPVTLHLKRRPTLALAGRVVGPGGSPLPDVPVIIQIRQSGQVLDASEFAFPGGDEVRSGPDGRFRTPTQVPAGYEYRVLARASGFEPAESRWVVPPDLAVPDLALRRSVAARGVAVRVVDSSGRPVAGVEVFQAGSSGEARSRTDPNGQSRISGVPAGPALLFVAAPGHHFVGRRVEPGERSVELALRRLDEPPAAPLRPAPPAVTRDEERAIARTLLADARQAPVSNDDPRERRELPRIAALIDPEQALALIEEQVLAAEPDLLADIAIGRSEFAARGAIEVLDAIGEPETRAAVALSLFDRLGAAAPAFRRDLLDRADRSARRIDESVRPTEYEPPGRAARLLAQVADRWSDLGDRDRGTALAREAEEFARRPAPPLPEGMMVARARGGYDASRDDLILAQAWADPAGALKGLEGRGDQEQRYQLDRLRGGIARRVAARDPAAARRLLAAIEESHRLPARRAVCLAMAATDLPTARVVAANGRDPMIGAILPAIAARLKAGSDPDAARALVRESVERLAQLDAGPGSAPASASASPAVTLARLLPLIARVDPERAPDACWLALSLRPAPPAELERRPVSSQARQQYLDLALLAAFVGRFDRAAAEVAFAPVLDRLPRLDDESWGLGNEGPAIFRAAGAYDARAARALLDALPDDPTPPPHPPNVIRASDHRHRSKAQARVALARSLALPPAIRLRGPVSAQAAGDDWLDALDD